MQTAVPWFASRSYSWFFSRVVGLRVSARFSSMTQTVKLADLQPALVAVSTFSESERHAVRMGVSLGLGPGMWSPHELPESREYGDFRSFEWKPTGTANLGFELTWMFAGSPRAGGWGVRLSANIVGGITRLSSYFVLPYVGLEQLINARGVDVLAGLKEARATSAPGPS